MKNIFLFCLSLLSGVVFAQNVKVLTPTEDTYIYKSEIHGMEPLLKTYHSTAGSQYRRQTFLTFDISSLSPNIQNVTFRIYAQDMAQATNLGKHKFRLTPVAKTSWAEDGIMFDDYLTKLGSLIDTSLAEAELADGAPAQYVEFQSDALTSIVRDSIENGVSLISFRLRETTVVKDAVTGSAVICDFHSKENESGHAPQLVVEEPNVTGLIAQWIQVDGELLTDFSPETYKYVVTLPWDASTLPEVTSQPALSDVSVTVTQATSLQGDTNARTARIDIEKAGMHLYYYVVFELGAAPTEARLKSLTVDGSPVEFFHMDQDSYVIHLPYTAITPMLVEAEPYDDHATVSVHQASSVDGTAYVDVKSADDNHTKRYSVTFHRLPELDIILAIGQSNMAGRASYIDYQDSMEQVYLLTPYGNMEIASNPMNKYSNIRKDLSIQGVGPSYQCALSLQTHLNKPVSFVVNAQGGSSINLWYEKGKANYDASLQRALQAQRYGHIKAIIWHQGSADNTAGLADNFESYKSKLATMVANFRRDLNEPELFFICGELSERSEFDAFSQQVIHPVATYIEHSDYVTTENCSLLSDGIHFDLPSVLLLGERYADKIIEHVYSSTRVGAVVSDNGTMVQSRQGGVNIQLSAPNVDVCIYDMTGHLVRRFTGKAGDNVLSLPQGLYVIYINDMKYVKVFKCMCNIHSAYMNTLA